MYQQCSPLDLISSLSLNHRNLQEGCVFLYATGQTQGHCGVQHLKIQCHVLQDFKSGKQSVSCVHQRTDRLPQVLSKCVLPAGQGIWDAVRSCSLCC